MIEKHSRIINWKLSWLHILIPNRISGSRETILLKFLDMLMQTKLWEKIFLKNTKKAIPPARRVRSEIGFFISEPGFYELIFASKLEAAKKFWGWVFSTVLPSIRKYGEYKLFDNPNNQMFKIENEADLHYKVVQYIRRFYPEAIMIAGLGENQKDSSEKRINSWRKGYMKGQPDIIIMNNHNEYNGLCIEFKSPTNNYKISEAQLEMKKRYKQNGSRILISNDYDEIIAYLNKQIWGVRIPFRYGSNQFRSKETYKTHIRSFHKR